MKLFTAPSGGHMAVLQAAVEVCYTSTQAISNCLCFGMHILILHDTLIITVAVVFHRKLRWVQSLLVNSPRRQAGPATLHLNA